MRNPAALQVVILILVAHSYGLSQQLTGDLSNITFSNGQSASGSFQFNSAGTVLSSSIVFSDPGLGYTALLGDAQDSSIISHSTPIQFIEIVLVNQKPTGSCSLGAQCGTTYVSLTIPGTLAKIATPGTYQLICGICDNTPAENTYTSSETTVDPPNYKGSAISSRGSMTVHYTSNTSPKPTDSYYIAMPNSATVGQATIRIEDTLHNLGVKIGQGQLSGNIGQDGVVALLFGRPSFDAQKQEYGATRFYYPYSPTSLTDIASLVQDFVIGYYNALGTNSSVHIRVIVSTTNQSVRILNGTAPAGVMFLHGWWWSQMVNSLASWVVTKGYAAQVDIAGGSNMESGFNDFDSTSQWVAGYSSVAQRYLYNLGAAYGYTQENLWWLSWGAPSAKPLPEVYSAGNGTQWANLSLYGFQHYNESVIMAGALTELGACSQYPDTTCIPAFTPAQGWQTLYGDLKSAGVGQSLPWSTDIRWCDSQYLDWATIY